jgi:hypothetical protein
LTLATASDCAVVGLVVDAAGLGSRPPKKVELRRGFLFIMDRPSEADRSWVAAAVVADDDADG